MLFFYVRRQGLGRFLSNYVCYADISIFFNRDRRRRRASFPRLAIWRRFRSSRTGLRRSEITGKIGNERVGFFLPSSQSVTVI
jgi:hypothetical protein